MDALKSFVENSASGNNNNNNNNNNQNQNQNQSNNNSNNSSGGFMDKINSLAGGGQDSEKNEDYLDKGVDAFQQYALGQGDQSNENAAEQAKDEQISDFIRSQYKDKTGSDLPIKDKETKLGF